MPDSLRTLSPALSALLVLPAACASAAARPDARPSQTFANAYPAPGDAGQRAPAWYVLRRAWVEVTRDLAATRVPPAVPLDARELERHTFAVAWLGHATMLVRAGSTWILLDPALFSTVGPVRGLGPRRLTPLPLARERLPRVDVVLISHDHFDHLDLPSVRHLAAQPGGPPRFLVGRGLGRWFAEHVGAPAEELGWWERRSVGDVEIAFVPAQHSSGRTPWSKNATLWGGWVIERAGRRFYFPGDTSYVAQLFRDVRDRVGGIQLAALPIGAYTPRAWMQFEHIDPSEAVKAHLLLGAPRSFGVHWATFQLGDEEPFQPAVDLTRAVLDAGVGGFDLVPIGGIVDVPPAAALDHCARLSPRRQSPAPAADLATTPGPP